MKEMGIETNLPLLPPTAEELRGRQRPNTRAVFAETLASPLGVADLRSSRAPMSRVSLIVDNTFPTPINAAPWNLERILSPTSTKWYMDGHAVQVGGVIVDSGKFNWDNGKFPMLTQPDESYHGIVYTQHFGPAAYIAKCRTHLMRDIGAQAAPMNAFPLEPGSETLALRMERHCSNALKVAQFLEADPGWPGWTTRSGREPQPRPGQEVHASRHLRRGVLPREGRPEAPTKFMDSLRWPLWSPMADPGTCRSRIRPAPNSTGK